MRINVRAPEGNVFVILGRFKRLADELDEAGVNVKEYRDLLSTATTMKYDQILDRIEEITHGEMTFVGREKNEEP